METAEFNEQPEPTAPPPPETAEFNEQTEPPPPPPPPSPPDDVSRVTQLTLYNDQWDMVVRRWQNVLHTWLRIEDETRFITSLLHQNASFNPAQPQLCSLRKSLSYYGLIHSNFEDGSVALNHGRDAGNYVYGVLMKMWAMGRGTGLPVKAFCPTRWTWSSGTP